MNRPLIGVLWGLILTGTAFGSIMTGIGVMGVAVIYGLGVATVLTRIVVPVTYQTLDELFGAVSRYTARPR